MRHAFGCVYRWVYVEEDPSWLMGVGGWHRWVMAFLSLPPEWNKPLWPPWGNAYSELSQNEHFLKGKRNRCKPLPAHRVAFPYSLCLHQLDLHFPVSPAASYQSDFCSFVTVLHKVSLSGSCSALTWGCFDVSALFPLCLWPPWLCMERSNCVVWCSVKGHVHLAQPVVAHTDPGLYSSCQGGRVTAV